MSDRYICLSWACSPFRVNVTDGIRLRIDITDASGMPKKIFAYQSLPMRPATNERAHAFDHVCSPPDLADYPEDNPLPNSHPDWLRLSYVDLFLRAETEAQAFLHQVIADIQSLKYTLDVLDTLQPGTEVCIGTVPTDSSSSIGSV